MKGLFRKDYELLKGNFKIFLCVYLVAIAFLFTSNNGEQMFIFYVTMISSILVLNTISYDEFDNGMSFLLTLPITPSIYVRSKYIFGVVMGLGGWAVSFTVASLFANWKNPVRDWTQWWIIGAVCLVIIFFIIVVMIPIQLKFGGENSRMIMLGVFLGTFVGGYLISQLFKILGIDVEAFIYQVSSMGAFVLFGILAVIIVVSVLISMKISEKIMTNKEF